MGQIKKTVDHRDRRVLWDGAQNDFFGNLIQRNDPSGDHRQLDIFVVEHVFFKKVPRFRVLRSGLNHKSQLLSGVTNDAINQLIIQYQWSEPEHLQPLNPEP